MKIRLFNILAVGVWAIPLIFLARPVHAQFIADTRDDAAISLRLGTLLNTIQKAKPDYLYWEQEGAILVDGVEKDEAAFRADILAAVAAAEYRMTIHPVLDGPFEGVFGPFEDFTIERGSQLITGDSCFVDCTFKLHIGGETSTPGLIKLHHDVFRGWNIVSIDGMMSLLNSAAQTGKRIIKMKVTPKKKK